MRNDCQFDLQNIESVLRDYADGREFARKRIARLRPGESVLVRHDRCDFSADVRFSLAGQSYACTQRYIDLWEGEGWIFAIQPDGRVLTGHESTDVCEPMESVTSRPGPESPAAL